LGFTISFDKKKKTRKQLEEDIDNSKYKDFSKKIVNHIELIGIAVLGFCCYEIHITGDMTALPNLIDGIVRLTYIVVASYMVRALFKDKANIDIFFSAQLSKLKKKFGDNFVQDKVEGIDTNIIG